MIYRMVYMSEATKDFGALELAHLLDTARRKNAAAGLTGVLIFHENRFFQVLEGPQGRVIDCLRTIKKDKRHSTIRVIEESASPTRAFPNWRMGYAQPDAMHPAVRQSVFSIYRLVSPLSEERGDDDAVRLHVRDFLASLVRLHGKAPLSQSMSA